MFVRIVKKTQFDDGSKKYQGETLYECKRCGIHAHGNDNVLIDLREPAISLELSKQDYEIYVMNEHGKTIDTCRWS